MFEDKQTISTEEGNRIIAEFMGGWYEVNDQPNPYWEGIWIGKLYPDTKDLDYQVRWDNLMQVVYKMNKAPWWIEYDSDYLQLALVSANISEAWNIVVKALIKYKDYEEV